MDHFPVYLGLPLLLCWLVALSPPDPRTKRRVDGDEEQAKQTSLEEHNDVPKEEDPWEARRVVRHGLGEFFAGGSVEPVLDVYHMIVSAHRAGFKRVFQFISPIGSFVAPLTILATLQLSPGGRVIFFDKNPATIVYASLTIKIISLAENPTQFLSFIYARDAEAFERQHGTITHRNQAGFIALPINTTLRQQMLAVLTQEERDFFVDVLLPFWANVSLADCESWGLPYKCLWPANDPAWVNQVLTPMCGMFHSGKLPSDLDMPVNGSWDYGTGWLANKAFYANLRRNLPFARVTRANFPDFFSDFGPCTVPKGERTLLFTMDMRPWNYFDMTHLRSFGTCGRSVSWLSSSELQEHICLTVDTADWSRMSSCSNWDSRHTRLFGQSLEKVCKGLRPTSQVDDLFSYRTPRHQYPTELVADVGQPSARWWLKCCPSSPPGTEGAWV